MSRKSNGFGTFLAGAAIGVGLGVLFAPKAGSETRKELNSIKPISRDAEVEEEVEVRPTKDDTLEKDLFNLIDSMYEEGEEDEDNG